MASTARKLKRSKPSNGVDNGYSSPISYEAGGAAVEESHASTAKKTKRSDNSEYSQLPHEADVAAEEFSQSPGSPEFLPPASTATKMKRSDNSEYSQLPYEVDAAAEELSQPSGSPEFLPPAGSSQQSPDSSSKSSQTEIVAKKENNSRALLTRERLLTVKCDKLRRQLAPIKRWGSLSVGHPYLLKRIISIPVHKKNDKPSSSKGMSYNRETSYYAELETDTEPLINVWITSIMLAESENYDLSSDDVYIIPLGKRISQENGNEYHAFVIVRADELEYNTN